MKCLERQVIAHISNIPETLDLLQFAYCPNRSTDGAISIGLHTALSHLDKRNTYVRILFIDYSSAFNTIVSTKLIPKLRTLGRNTSLYNWILDFLTSCPQVVSVGNNTSATLTLNLSVRCQDNNYSITWCPHRQQTIMVHGTQSWDTMQIVRIAVWLTI